MNARWLIKKSWEALDRTMKDPRSTPVDELNACLTFGRFRFFLLLSGEDSYKRKKLRKLSGRLENLRILNHHF